MDVTGPVLSSWTVAVAMLAIAAFAASGLLARMAARGGGAPAGGLGGKLLVAGLGADLLLLVLVVARP